VRAGCERETTKGSQHEVTLANYLFFGDYGHRGGGARAGQTVAPAGAGVGAPAPRAAAIPDLSGAWSHPYLPGFEPPPSGPGPITNRERMPNGVSNWNKLVGDYTNPILKPDAAEVVKRYGEISLRA